jgi:predicted KAP-like P-loop ATPase
MIIPKLERFKEDKETTQKELKQLELSMLRILEKCDGLNPSELMSAEEADPSDFFILPHLVDNRANDEAFMEIMEAASVSFRKNRSLLVGRVNSILKELDHVCKNVGVEL